MGSLLFPLTLIHLSLSLLQKSESLEIKSSKALDFLIRDYALRSYNTTTFKTGKLYDVNLPTTLSGIDADTIRLRCGSLQRYGARIKEFYLNNGINVHPCIQRVILVRQSVAAASNWSSLYYRSYELSGYQLISPILGLVGYSIVDDNSNSLSSIVASPADLWGRPGKSITIDFTNTTLSINATRENISPLCASFDRDGKVTLSSQTRPNVCVVGGPGHFGLVVESPLMPVKGKVGKVKIVVVSSIGAALGAFLLSLLVVAMLVNAKKKARMDEMERRAYEEEALQVSMVGHVRAVTAAGTRTAPIIEHHEYRVRRP